MNRQAAPAADADIEFSWNQMSPYAQRAKSAAGSIFDETLRDGIQAPGVTTPSLEQKLYLVDHMVGCGIRSADLGFPGASVRAADECRRIAEYIIRSGYPLAPGFAGRTHPSDVAAICEIAQATGAPVDAYVFAGVSPIRQYIEGWDFATIERGIRSSAIACARGGVRFVLVLEDALRCTAGILSRVYDVAIDVGVQRLTICDTVGIATPAGTEAILSWSARYFADREHPVLFDWHGHNDRGLAVINSLIALEFGCDRVHGTVLGIGERAGNTALDQIIINRYLETRDGYNLKALHKYCERASDLLNVEIPGNYPGMGSDVFKTSAGVHAAAILKAHQKGDNLLKDNVYSSIPASLLGRQQDVLIDASSGVSNVKYWSIIKDINVDDELIGKVIDSAKNSRRPLSDDQIKHIIAGG